MTSSLITAFAVNNRSKPSCVRRQNVRVASDDSVPNHAAAIAWWTCPSYVSATQTLMSGKYDVVDGGIVEGHGARALGPDDGQRHRSSDLPALRLQDLLDAA